MKTCNICGESKDLSAFYKEKENKDGHSNRCKSCKDALSRKWRAKKRETWNAYMREYNAKHYDSEKFQRRQRNRSLKFHYGITLVEYEVMAKAQNNVCALCLLAPKRKLVVDHHHGNGNVRGLLCDGCNVAIAILDNPELLAKAQAYLARQA